MKSTTFVLGALALLTPASSHASALNNLPGTDVNAIVTGISIPPAPNRHTPTPSAVPATLVTRASEGQPGWTPVSRDKRTTTATEESAIATETQHKGPVTLRIMHGDDETAGARWPGMRPCVPCVVLREESGEEQRGPAVGFGHGPRVPPCCAVGLSGQSVGDV